ncbi:Uncharacterised protein [Mycobacteroides abscessus subsp. abscessus]|nr:Uncharacterised protein [Mycobacteroides abscessus subsp. abscessus]
MASDFFAYSDSPPPNGGSTAPAPSTRVTETSWWKWRLASSVSCPATSTPVAPAPTTTKLSSRCLVASSAVAASVNTRSIWARSSFASSMVLSE